MFRQFIRDLHEHLALVGPPSRRWGVIRDLVERFNGGATETDVLAHAQATYQGISPDTWKKIIDLIIQFLPILLAIFGL